MQPLNGGKILLRVVLTALICAGTSGFSLAQQAPAPGTTAGERLWLPVSSTQTLHGYSAAQLASPTNINGPGSVTITGAGLRPFGVAFDDAGNMYVADRNGNSVLIYAAPQTINSTSAPPAGTIASGARRALVEPVGLAFDAAGSLWVSNYFGNSIVKYTAAQLARVLPFESPRRPAPAVVIRCPIFDFPYGHAFDRAGNLWVANDRNNSVLKFARADLATSGTITPTQIVTRTTTGVLVNPHSPVFDAAGNLWVASSRNNQVVKYTINPTTGAATPTITATLRLNTTTIARPSALAFDNAGNLWITDDIHEAVLKYNIASITNGASVMPAKIITGFGEIGGVLHAFGPPPPVPPPPSAPPPPAPPPPAPPPPAGPAPVQ